MKKTIIASSLAVGLGLVAGNVSHADASENQINKEKLAQLAESNDQSLNQHPIQEGAYNYQFNLNGKTYHYQGVLSWYDSQYGNYIPAVKMENHANSDLGKVFADDGTANKTANSLANGRGKYFKLSNLNTTETESMKVTKNSTWNNIVHKTDWLSEKDYNNYSGWMTIIDGNTDNLGVDTVLSDTKEHTVCLDFSMMMGLDLGFSSYVQQGDQWIQVPGWK